MPVAVTVNEAAPEVQIFASVGCVPIAATVFTVSALRVEVAAAHGDRVQQQPDNEYHDVAYVLQGP